MSCDVASLRLRADQAIELGELLEFLADWLAGTPDVFADASATSAGGAYTVEDLRADLARFAFVLGSDGERFVFGDDR